MMDRLFAFLLVLVPISAKFDFIQTNSAFSASIYKKFAKNEPGNFVLSPLSAEVLLSLLEVGCKGETAQEVRYELYGQDSDTSNFALARLLQELPSKDYTMDVSSKVYVQEDFPVNPEFRSQASILYNAGSSNLDFTRPGEAAEIINNWVKNATNNKIQSLIDSSNLDERTRLVLLNTAYFKANWSRPFPVAYTRKMGFTLPSSQIVDVDMMLLHEKNFNYLESPELRARFLEIPFRGNKASMVIALPDDSFGLQLLESHLRKVLRLRKFTKKLVNVGLPRFKIGTSVDLKPILKKTGIRKVFDPTQADLSGIAGIKGDLVVDQVAQKTFIEVGEEGVEAAAATYHLLAVPMSAPAEKPKRFVVDRPFIFYIKIKDVVVYVGRVVDPRL